MEELRKSKAKEMAESEEAKAKIEAKIKRKGLAVKACSWLVVIVQKKVANSKGRFMPEWEETAAVACAMQNAHLMCKALGLGAYWSSTKDTKPPAALREFLGLEEEDLCLGVFHVGVCGPKAAKYRSRRGPIADKVKWW